MSTPEPPDYEEKPVYLRLRGQLLADWQELLRGEGPSQQHHGAAAIAAYIKSKGYPKKPTT